MKRISAAGLVGALALGCGATRQMTASVQDYDLYRQTRLAPTLERRLQASHRYLQKMPDGRWRQEVDVWYKEAERAFFEQARGSAQRLRDYLRLLPDGPRAGRARQQLAELNLQAEAQRRRERSFTLQVQQYERELARAEEQRRQLVLKFVAFVRHLARITTWGQPTWELDPRLIVDWRLRPPAGRCRASRCVKTLSARYAIPDAREIVPRQAIFDVVFELHHGGIVRAVLTGPELFNRISEASQLRPVGPGDVMARASAIAAVLELIEPVVEQSYPAGPCSRPAVSPVVLLRECDGRRLRVVAPAAPEEDRIEVESTAP